MNCLTIVMYHYVRRISDSAFPMIRGLEFEGFKRQLDYLEARFNIITAEQLIAQVLGAEEIPEKSCLLTFDDGYKDHFQYVLPELLNRKIQGTFFLPVKAITEREILNVNCIHFILACQSNLEHLIDAVRNACLANGVSGQEFTQHWQSLAVSNRFDSKEVVFLKRLLQHALPEDLRNGICAQLFRKHVSENPTEFANELYISLEDTKELVASGMYVGSHGYSHTWLNKESKQIQEHEINLSLEFLWMIGAPTENWMMCYPYGAYNDDTLSILRAKKCSAAVTTKVGIAQLDADKLLELSRFDTNDFPQ
jgi:peptidoglycan/xylan/chitin deacetylase (PgdA/CDA1 family)